MTKQILFIVILLCSALNVNAAEDIKFPDIPTLPTRPRVQDMSVDSFTPVSVDLSSNTCLNINFTSSTGIAQIMVINSNGLIIYKESFNTNKSTNLFISTENWLSGNYTITIITKNNTLKVEYKK